MTAPASLLSGFHYFGAGNIGDDLMFAGLVEAVSTLGLSGRLRLYGYTRWNMDALRRRFPETTWCRRDRPEVEHARREWPRDCWAAVGDTPLQYALGDWLLKYWMEELDFIRTFRSRIMINIGAESEIAPRAADFSRVCAEYDRISTRDEHSYRIVTDVLRVPPERVRLASDLAHVVLRKALPRPTPKTEKLGVILTGDTLAPRDLACIRSFVAERDRPTLFLANVANEAIDNEVTLYRKLSRRWWPWDRFTRQTRLWVPDYDKGSVAELLQGIASCETVFSSRYHGILIAAWAGCRVAAIGRSSKVTALAEELGIGCCRPPFDRDSVRAAFEAAAFVPRAKLERLADLALEGVRFALDEK